MVDPEKLNAFIGRILNDLGGALSVPMVRIGDRLGLYRALHARGPMDAGELAKEADIAERYAREWLSHQAASGYVEYDAASGRFSLPPEQAMVFAEVDSPVYLQGAFDLAVTMMENQAQVEPAFRSGKGVGWGDQAPCLFCTVGRFFRPGYHNNLVQSWLPALDGVVEKLTPRRQGRRCRVRTWLLDRHHGQGFPQLHLLSAMISTLHPSRQARVHAEQHGTTQNIRFEVALASDFPGENHDLVTFFDCLHDMGDPTGAARHGASIAETGRKLVDRRAGGRRSAGGQFEPGQPHVFRRLDDDLHSDLPRPACRRRARRPGGTGQTVVGYRGRGISAGAQGDGNAVQHDPRSAPPESFPCPRGSEASRIQPPRAGSSARVQFFRPPHR